MKILQIYKDYYPPVIGGIEGHINTLSKGLVKSGIDVEVLVSNTNNKVEIEKIDDIIINKSPQIFRYASAPINHYLPIHLKELSYQSDIIHLHLPNPTAVCSYLINNIKKPIIATYHSDIVRQVNLNKIYKPFQSIFLKKIQAIVATSPNYVESSKVLRKFRDKCHIIPLGIDTNKFKTININKIKRIKSEYGKNIILFVGKLRYYKGLNILINSMKNVNGVLVVIGDGPLKRQLKEQIFFEKLENKVKMLGELSRQEVNNYIHACTVFVLPSVLRSEAFGIVLAEAMACGKPVISTELGTGTSYINVHKKTGLVVKPNNAKLLSDAINCIISDKNKTKEYGKAAKERIYLNFTSEIMVQKTINLYKSVIGNKNGLKLSMEPNNNVRHIFKIDHNPQEEKIKILRVISRLNIGGPSVHAKILSEKLHKSKFKTKLLVGSLSRNEGDMSYLFNGNNDFITKVKMLQREINPIKDLMAFFKILYVITIEKPNIIHTHMAKAGAVGRFAALVYNIFNTKNKVLIVHTFHGHIFNNYFSSNVTKLFITVERFIAKYTDKIIAISHTQKWELSKLYMIAGEDKIHTINLGFDLKRFFNNTGKGQIRTSYEIYSDTILIGIVGRLVPIKNHLLFLDAAKKIKEKLHYKSIKFVIIGDGELRTMLENYAYETGMKDDIIFSGWIRNIEKVYNDLDILLLTSDNEGTPVSIIEAMASGVPVITTSVGGIKDLLGKIEDGTFNKKNYNICERGILCPKRNSEAIANGVEYIIKNDNKDRIIKAKKFVSQNYTDQKLVGNIEKLYTTLVFNCHKSKCKL